MTHWYFEEDECWAPVKEELISWEDTPYRHLQAVKGRAADCSLFLFKVLEKFHLAGPWKAPDLQNDWWLHSDKEILIECWRDCLAATAPYNHWWYSLDPTVEKIFRGDLLIFNVGLNVSTHAAIFIGPTLIHSLNRASSGVFQSTYGSWWKRRITKMWRLGSIK